MASGSSFSHTRDRDPVSPAAGAAFKHTRGAPLKSAGGSAFAHTRGEPLPKSSVSGKFDATVKAVLIVPDKTGAVFDHLVRSVDPSIGSVFDASAKSISVVPDKSGAAFDSTVRAIFPATDQLGIVYENTVQRVDPPTSIYGSTYDNTVTFIPPVTSSGLGATVDGVILPFIDGVSPAVSLEDKSLIKGVLDPRRPVGTGDGLGAGVSGYEESADRIVGEIIT